jgi:S-adenosylmethionine hydrolase
LIIPNLSKKNQTVPVVTLTTDFGDKDYYAGALKGELLQAFPGITIVDISHNIKPYNISEAAFVLRNSYASFPAGTVHIVTVNDQDERNIRYIAAEYESQYFLGLDNGIFTMVFNGPPANIVEIPSHKQNGTLVTFPTKRIFSKAASQLCAGTPLAELGTALTSLNKRMGLEPVVQESLIRGTVIHVDSFQNVIVNVTKDLFTRVRNNRNFSVSYRSKRSEAISAINDSYYDVPQGERVCLFNSSGYLEIAINCGEASSLLGIKVGDYVLIDFE